MSDRFYRIKQTDSKVDVSKLFDKLPPHALEAEMALLGSMLHDWRVCAEVTEIVRSADEFYKLSHGVIFEHLAELSQTNNNADIVQLTERLKDKGLLEEIGDVEYLAELAESVPSSAAAAHYARIVADKALQRRLMEATAEALWDASNATDANEVIDSIESKILAVRREKTSGDEVANVGSILQAAYDKLQNNDLPPAISTGFAELDELHDGGFRPEEFIIIGARPSMGKTALGLDIATAMSCKHGKPGLFFSLEMGHAQLAPRLFSARARVESHKIRRNMLNEEEFRKLDIAVKELADSPMRVDFTPGLKLESIVSRSRRAVREYGAEWVVVDYIQLIHSIKKFSGRLEEVAHISVTLKQLSRELKIPVIAMAQLNRETTKRGNNFKPRMSDLREAGNLEQDADVVWLLHREEYYHKDDKDWKADNPDLEGVAEVIVDKQRNGPPGVIRLDWLAHFACFANRPIERETKFRPPNRQPRVAQLY